MSMLRKTCALVAVALIIPALAHAKDGGKSEQREDNDKGGKSEQREDNKGGKKGEHEDNDKGGKSEQREEQRENNKGNNGHHKVTAVPEANAGWVLLPFIGAVLVLSWRQLSRVKA